MIFSAFYITSRGSRISLHDNRGKHSSLQIREADEGEITSTHTYELTQKV